METKIGNLVRVIVWAEVAWCIIFATICYGALTTGPIGELNRTFECVETKFAELERSAESDTSHHASLHTDHHSKPVAEKKSEVCEAGWASWASVLR